MLLTVSQVMNQVQTDPIDGKMTSGEKVLLTDQDNESTYIFRN